MLVCRLRRIRPVHVTVELPISPVSPKPVNT
jgi:hypothetical protein